MGRIIEIALVLGGLLFIGLLFVSHSDHHMERARTIEATSRLREACFKYRDEYGRFPEISGNHGLVEVFKGSNPRGLVFMEPDSKYLSADGEIVDGWGTPLRISYLSGDDLLILSAGKDKLFGSKDDLSNKK